MAVQVRPIEAEWEEPEARRHHLRRWIIPIGGGLLSAILIVIATPHVPWYFRLALALIAFLYISGQSAMYLWSSHSDQARSGAE